MILFPSLHGGTAETLDELRERGARHYEAQEYFAAIQAFEAALEKAATDDDRQHMQRLLARVRTALGMEFFNTGEMRQAERAFRKVIEGFDDSYARFGLGYLHFLRFEDQTAREHLERAVQLDPEYARSHMLLALMDYRAGKSASALKLIKKAVRLAPEDTEARALVERWQHELPYTDRLEASRHGRFLIRSDRKIPAYRRRQVVTMLERSRRKVGEALGHWSRQPVVVILFTEDVFHRATGSRHWVGGTYDGRLKLPVPTRADLKPGDLQKLEEAVRHEMAHVTMRELLPECPSWLNEGIAQHFEYEVKNSPELNRRLWQGRARKVAFSKVPGRLWKLDDEALARWTYLQGYGFVEYLVENFAEFRLRLLVDGIRAEGSLETAFRRTYGVSLSDLEVAWWREVERSARGAR